MIVQAESSGSLDGMQQMIEKVAQTKTTQSLIILACDDNGFTPHQVDPLLSAVKQPVFGGTFPALIHGSRKLDRGTIVVGLPYDLQVLTVSELSNPDKDFDAALDELSPFTGSDQTMVVLVDGFARRISAFIDSLFCTFGLELNYVGGGAGSLSMAAKPCLFTNQGMLQDSAVIACLHTRSGIGVSHGWQAISGPYKVTESDHNRIISLDWQPAFEVYRQVVESHGGRQFDDRNFLELAGAYPFGITKMESEPVVRDPIMTDEQGGLTCVGEVFQGSFVDILNGDNQSLIEAAGHALHQARENYGRSDPKAATLFIDCISRVLFLKEQFDREINAVQMPDTPLFGVCSLGEIANSGDDYLEFYNKTSVVAILGDR